MNKSSVDLLDSVVIALVWCVWPEYVCVRWFAITRSLPRSIRFKSSPYGVDRGLLTIRYPFAFVPVLTTRDGTFCRLLECSAPSGLGAVPTSALRSPVMINPSPRSVFASRVNAS
jgi:hypothetical protein